MKTAATHPTAWTRPTRSPRKRAMAIGLAMLGTALLAQAASPPCPPGYRQKGSQCLPGPAQPQSHSATTVLPGVGVPVVTKPRTPPVEKKRVDPLKQPSPPNPGPLHASAPSETAIDHGGKQALNPQPIPPGHTLKPTPHPGAPIEAKGH